jgi:hypothetical protein
MVRSSAATAAPVQRACANPTACQTGCDGCARSVPALQRDAVAGAAAPSGPPAAVHQALAGRGASLPRAVHGDLERFFGAALPDLRIHQGAAADAAARSVGGRAFTVGSNIVFGAGADPLSDPALLRHEATHVLQQAGGRGPSGWVDGGAADPLEREARDAAQGRAPGPALHPALQRGPMHAPAAAASVQRDDTPPAAPAPAPAPPVAAPAVVPAATVTGPVVPDPTTLQRVWAVYMREGQTGLVRELRALDSTARRALNAGWAERGGSTLGAYVLSWSSPETRREVLSLLWPALSLPEKLDALALPNMEIEEGMLDVIRAAPVAERIAARSDTARTDRILATMSADQAFEARLLLWPDPSGDRETRLAAARTRIADADGYLDDDEDAVWRVVGQLTPADRAALCAEGAPSFLDEGADTTAWSNLCGARNEGEVLSERLRLATEGRIDDTVGVADVVRRAAELAREQDRLRGLRDAPELPAAERDQIQTRLDEIGDLRGQLLHLDATGAPTSSSFLGRLETAADSPAQYGEWARSLGLDPYAAARRRILLAGSDAPAIQDALRDVHDTAEHPEDAALTPEMRVRRRRERDAALRQRLLEDPEVSTVVGDLGSIDRSTLDAYTSADAYHIAISDLNAARFHGDRATVLRTIVGLTPEQRRRFYDNRGELWGAWSWLDADMRATITSMVTREGRPAEEQGDFLTGGPGAEVLARGESAEVLVEVVRATPDAERRRLRTGYLLARRGGPAPTDDASIAALRTWRDLETRLQANVSGAEDRVKVLDAILADPLADDLQDNRARLDAAGVRLYQQRDHLAIGRGASAGFTETDETMDVAATEYAVLYEQLLAAGGASEADLARLVALDEQFRRRSGEFAVASDRVGEIAATVASTVAAIVLTAATGGAGSPLAIALVASGSAVARVGTADAFGGDHYDATGAAGGRDALIGLVDGAFVSIGSSLGRAGASMIGLGGRELGHAAARAGAQAAEVGAVSLRTRVAAATVEGAIDGAIGGLAAGAVDALTDPAVWRRGVWAGLGAMGQRMLISGAFGAVGGGGAGAALTAGRAAVRRIGEGLRAGDELLDVADDAARLSGAPDGAGHAADGAGHTADGAGDAAGAGRRTAEDAAAEADALARAGTHEGPALTEVDIAAERTWVDANAGRTRRIDHPNYDAEIHLPNGHTWRRNRAGGWCRFTGNPVFVGLANGPVRPAGAPAAPASRHRFVEQLDTQFVGAQGPYIFGGNAQHLRLAAMARAAETVVPGNVVAPSMSVVAYVGGRTQHVTSPFLDAQGRTILTASGVYATDTTVPGVIRTREGALLDADTPIRPRRPLPVEVPIGGGRTAVVYRVSEAAGGISPILNDRGAPSGRHDWSDILGRTLDSPTGAQTVAHSEIALYTLIERNPQAVADMLVAQGVPAGTPIDRIVLDLHSTRSMCGGCAGGALVLPDRIRASIAQALRARGYVVPPTGLPIHTRVSFDRYFQVAAADIAMPRPFFAMPEPFVQAHVPRVAQADASSTILDDLVPSFCARM